MTNNKSRHNGGIYCLFSKFGFYAGHRISEFFRKVHPVFYGLNAIQHCGVRPVELMSYST